MRWFWIDRFVELVSGQHATAIKAVSLSGEQLHDHFPGHALMPNSLVIEGMAQTGGLLVSEYNDFRERVVLAKLSRSCFHFYAEAGDTLTYRASIEQISSNGAMVQATSHVGDRLQGEANIVLAHLNGNHGDQVLYDNIDFLIWLRLLRIFDVGRKPDGSRLDVPAHLAQAELTSDRIDQDGIGGAKSSPIAEQAN
ncbi:MAG: beta-hydroxyacyl-ACP dehydratase [Pirellulales bacterium]